MCFVQKKKKILISRSWSVHDQLFGVQDDLHRYFSINEFIFFQTCLSAELLHWTHNIA